MLDWQQVHAAVRPLRLIFWGALIWIIDLTFTTTTNGTGFRFDLLDDTLATVMISVAVFRLARAPVPRPYPAVMAFIKVVAILAVCDTALRHFVFDRPAILAFASESIGLGELIATTLFCLAMKWFCQAAALPRPAASWRVTFLLFVIIYALPLGVLSILALISLITDRPPLQVNLGAPGLLLLPLFIVPLVHLFVSTSRMRRVADAGVTPLDHAAGGFPVVIPNAASEEPRSDE